ncbi:hypothetical protein [Streptomyces sp. NPDC046909]|uniref:hypothetical protein n=1 Tax=Streptomyces sp. NPDC046909 TaxID=3155617 RepID=UPI0034072A16
MYLVAGSAGPSFHLTPVTHFLPDGTWTLTLPATLPADFTVEKRSHEGIDDRSAAEPLESSE